MAGFVGVSNVLERRRARGSRSGPRRSDPRAEWHTGPTGLHIEKGTIKAVAYAGMITRYLVELEAGGELQVVRQNLETSSAEAQEQRGRKVTIGWRPDQTRRRQRRERRNRSEPIQSCTRRWVPAVIVAGFALFMLAVAGCGGDDDDETTVATEPRASADRGRPRPRGAQPDRLARLREPIPWRRSRFREADGLQGQRQGGRHLGRVRRPDADRPVRRRLGLGQRVAPPRRRR